MKKIYLLLLTLFTCVIINAQIIYSTGFEEYNNNDKVAATIGTPWTTWSNAPGTAEDPVISDSFGHESEFSMKVVTNNDALYKPETTITNGVYKIEFYIYVPAGKLGYWNILQNANGNNSIWGLQASLYSDGSVKYDFNNTAIYGNYNTTAWNKYTSYINLDKDLCILYFNDEFVLSYTWSKATTGEGENAIAAVNFFGWDNDGAGTSEYYIDDFLIEKITEPSESELTITHTIENTNNVSLSWNEIEGASNYIILKDGLFFGTSDTTTYYDENLYPSAYFYQVLANFASINAAITSNVDTIDIEGGVERENVLFETFTSIGCTYCPIAETAMKHIISSGLKVNTIDYHWNIYGDPYTTSDVTPRISYYDERLGNITGTPATIINGRFFMGGAYPINTQKALYEDGYIQSMRKKSCFTIETNMEVISNATNNYQATLDVNIKEVFAYYNGPIKLHVVLIENDITKSWGNSYGTFTKVNHLERKMYPNSNGTSVTIGEDSTANYQIPISITQNYNIANCKLIVFLQEQTTGEILQSIEIEVSQDIETNINENLIDNISVYPNPTNNFVNIYSKNEISNISVLDISGKEINKKSINSNSANLNVENFANGVYFLKIESSNGNISIKKLFVK